MLESYWTGSPQYWSRLSEMHNTKMISSQNPTAVLVLYGAKIIGLRKWMHVYVSKANRSEVLAVLNLINRGANQTFL